MELTTEQALQQGITAHREGKLQDAERLYRAILQSQPAHPDANHNLGVLAVSANKPGAALPLFKNALESNPKIEQFWLSYIDALIKEKQFELAKQVLDQAKKQGLEGEKLNALGVKLASKNKADDIIEVSPSQEQLSKLLEHYQNGRFADAEQVATSITREYPKHQFAYSVLGAVFGQTGRKSEAVNASQTAVALSPQDAVAHYNLGVALQELGRLDDAEASYSQAIALKPDYAEAHSNLGITLKELGRLNQAEASYSQAIALKPDYAEAHSNLGIALQELGRLAEAEASFSQAIALKPDFAQAHSNLGNILTELGRLDEAEASFTQAIASKPDHAETHNNLGNTLKELGRLDDAVASYNQAITSKPYFAEAHNNLGNTLRGLGRLDDAVASYNQAIKSKPDFAEAHSNLGVTLKEMGRLEEAATSYNQAIALRPDFAQAHSNLGSTLKELGKFEEAEASYTQAIALEPDFAEAIKNKWLLFFNKKDFEAALSHSDAHISARASAYDLITLYALGRVEEIYKRIESLSKVDGENINIAAFAAFISEAEKKATAYKFCPEPINFVHFSNLASHIKDSAEFIAEVIRELDKVKTVWEPAGKSTNGGFQTLIGTNLFKSPLGKIAQLKSIIIDEIKAYYKKYHNESCSYIQKPPSGNNLYGWHVVLRHQGHQNPHIHPGGWLSGVIYLKVVPSLGRDEGAIEFSLNGEHYSNINSPQLVYQPEPGDIVFFPSSLHHRTIPFTTDTERIIVSFDLMPETAKH